MQQTKQVLVVTPFEETRQKLFREQNPELDFIFTSEREVTREQLEQAEIVLGNPPVDKLRGVKKLRWIQLTSAGANGYTDPGVLPEGAVLTNATGAYGLTISEHMLGMLLMLYKQLHILRDQQNKCLWQSGRTVKTLVGAKVLVLGAGNIGTEFAKRVKVLGSYVIGMRRVGGDFPDCFDEMHTMKDLDDLLPKADVVAMSLPATPETTKIINAERLKLMKDDAVILNVGRGVSIDTDALVETMKAGKLWGAGLDVTDPEPLPADHPLWKIPNVIITPHCSGGFGLGTTVGIIMDIFRKNAGLFQKGEPMVNVVDMQTGYRKR